MENSQIYDIENGNEISAQISLLSPALMYYDYGEIYISKKNYLIAGISFEDDQYSVYEYRDGQITEIASVYFGNDIDDNFYIWGDYDGGIQEYEAFINDFGFGDTLVIIKIASWWSPDEVARNDMTKILAMTAG